MKQIMRYLVLIFLLSLESIHGKTPGLAIITLVTGAESPYTAGAMALGQSLVDVGSTLTRIVMVTPDVDPKSRESMSSLWEVKEVETISCNHKPNLDPTKFDLNGEQYKQGVARWSATCTKFRAWTLTQFDRVIFMDSDMIVVAPIDDAFYGYSNASFVAAPETFPPDNFNAGFMVLNPNMDVFHELVRLNEKMGSAEGGDQGIFNNGLCPQWYTVGNNDKDCGRLPWIFNVEAAHYDKYSTLRKMSNARPPAVIHFVSDGKPWAVLLFEYLPEGPDAIAPSTLYTLGKQVTAHVLWRKAFFTASGDRPPENRVLIRAVEMIEGIGSGSGVGGTVIDYGDEDGDFMQLGGNIEEEMDSDQDEESEGDEDEDNDNDDHDEGGEEDEIEETPRIRRRRSSSQRGNAADQITSKRGQSEGKRGRAGRRNNGGNRDRGPGEGRGRRGKQRRRNNRGSEADML